MKTAILMTLMFTSFVNAQRDLPIPIEKQDILVNPDAIIRVKQGCNLTGWQNNNKTHTFFVSCGGKNKSFTVNNLGKLDGAAILTTEQDTEISVQRSTKYGIDWGKANEILKKHN